MRDKFEKIKEIYGEKSPKSLSGQSASKILSPKQISNSNEKNLIELFSRRLAPVRFLGRIGMTAIRRLASASRWKKAGLAMAFILLIAGGAALMNIFNVRSASYSWIQTTWMGGADTVNFPTHTSNQTGWTKFYSKDANVDVTSSPGDVKLTQATGTSFQTTATGGGIAATITANGAVRTNNVVTITTSAAHTFQAKMSVTITGVTDASFNGTFTIASVPSSTTFTYAQAGANASSGNGTATASDTPNVGGFNAWTKPNAYVSGTGTGASLTLSKPIGTSCTTTSECATGLICGCGTCQSPPWISGCCGVQVYYMDEPGAYQWKNAQTDCRGPECATGLDPSYPSNYSLIWSNSNNYFASYPARLACYNRGGRLPTMTELSCIHTNRANLGAFQPAYYWSATEYSTNSALAVYFGNGGAFGASKTLGIAVRCVR